MVYHPRVSPEKTREKSETHSGGIVTGRVKHGQETEDSPGTVFFNGNTEGSETTGGEFLSLGAVRLDDGGVGVTKFQNPIMMPKSKL